MNERKQRSRYLISNIALNVWLRGIIDGLTPTNQSDGNPSPTIQLDSTFSIVTNYLIL